MKITKGNIISEYPKIDQSILPKELDKKEFEFVEGSLDLYNDADEIKEYIDTFILKLNQIVSKSPEKKKPVNKIAPKKPKTKEKIGVYDIVFYKKEIGFVHDIPNKNNNYYGVHFKGSDYQSINPKDIELFVKAGGDWHKKVLLKTDLEKIYKKNKNKKDFKYAVDEIFAKENFHAKPKQKPVQKKKDTSKKVGNVDFQVTLIKSFVLMNGKDKTQKQVLNLYKRIEKAATELKIRKTSKYANEITYISNKLKDYYNNADGNLETIVSVSISEKKYNELHKIAYSERQKTSVMLIKRYVGMYGLKDADKRAENLIKAIRSAYNKNKITKDDLYYNKIKAIESNLEAYLLKSKDLHPTGFDLKGLAGIAGIKLSVPEKKNPGTKKKFKKPVKSKKHVPEENKYLPVKNVKPKSNGLQGIPMQQYGFIPANQELKKADDIFQLDGDIGKFLQDIQQYKELIVIKGNKHTNKSQLAMQIANGLGEKNMKVAYIDYEQGGLKSKDTQDSINWNTTEKGRKNIFVTGFLEDPFSDLTKIAKQADAIVADSVTDLRITADQLSDLRTTYPHVIWVFIAQVKENGEMYGGNKMAHNPTKVIKCHQDIDMKTRYATFEKNRGNDNLLMYCMYIKKIIEKTPTQSRMEEEVKKKKGEKEEKEKEKELKKKEIKKE